jgi:hypothetical protein
LIFGDGLLENSDSISGRDGVVHQIFVNMLRDELNLIPMWNLRIARFGRIVTFQVDSVVAESRFPFVWIEQPFYSLLLRFLSLLLISYPIERWVVNWLTVVTCGDATSCFDVVAKVGTNAAFSCAGFKQCNSTCGLREVSERVFPRRSGDFWVCIIVRPHGFANDSQLCNRGSAEFSQHIPPFRCQNFPLANLHRHRLSI